MSEKTREEKLLILTNEKRTIEEKEKRPSQLSEE